jgi:hypothetical protein
MYENVIQMQRMKFVKMAAKIMKPLCVHLQQFTKTLEFKSL